MPNCLLHFLRICVLVFSIILVESVLSIKSNVTKPVSAIHFLFVYCFSVVCYQQQQKLNSKGLFGIICSPGSHWTCPSSKVWDIYMVYIPYQFYIQGNICIALDVNHVSYKR